MRIKIPVGALRLLWEPIPAEKRALLRQRWADLDPRWQIASQGYGQQATGCGATIGIQPRCDFDCRGCYLGSEANRLRPLAVDEILRQLDRLRAYLGPKGNVQITDGEVTLLPPDVLVSILHYAKRIGLIPMLMTHGDGFRRDPGLLTKLISEGGLTEIAIHIDSTQRGRLGYREVTDEAGLMPLRDEFVAMIRKVRHRTGRPLRAALTMTVTQENLDDVAAIMEWCLRNRDAFGFISFQPLAQVGRTRRDLRGVSSGELWERIARALAPHGFDGTETSAYLFGHPECSRVEPLLVLERSEEPPHIVSILRPGHAEDAAVAREFFARGLGGINFRDDTRLEQFCRAGGVLRTELPWLVGPARRWLARRAADLGISLGRLALDMIRGRIRLGTLTVGSHHFMAEDELRTTSGQERLQACVFRLPIDGRMVSMCEVNATGYRAAVHAGAASS